jgi:hypothetical protein
VLLLILLVKQFDSVCVGDRAVVEISVDASIDIQEVVDP